MSLSDISSETESLISSNSGSDESQQRVDLTSFKNTINAVNDSKWKKKSFLLESKTVELPKDELSKRDVKSSLDCDDESILSDFSKSLIEIGLPSILKFKSKMEEINQSYSGLFNSSDKHDAILDCEIFFSKNLQEYLDGGLKCEFCQSITLKWPKSITLSASTKFCCSDYRDYVQGIIEHEKIKEAIRNKITIDNFRSAAYLENIQKKKKLIEKKLAELRKFENNYIKPSFKLPKPKPKPKPKRAQSFSAITKAKRFSIKPIEPLIAITIDKIGDFIKEESEPEEVVSQVSTKNDDQSSHIVSYKAPETKDKINFLLSNMQHIEQGWTVIHKQKESRKIEVEEEKSKDEERSASAFDLMEIIPMQFTKTTKKNYGTGNLFELILSDKTGSIYYPSGELAIILSVSNDFRTFIAFSNNGKYSIPLAYFDSKGNGSCNYPNGKLRYQLNPSGAINFDENGNCIKKWLWPPDTKVNNFPPIIFKLNEYMSIKIISRSKIVFKFSSKKACCKFLVSTKGDNKKINRKNSEHFYPNMTDKNCIKLKEKADLLLKILAKGYPDKNEEEMVKSMITEQEDPFSFKLPKIKDARLTSLNNTARSSLNHSSILSTEREKILLDHLSKRNSINFTLQTINSR